MSILGKISERSTSYIGLVIFIVAAYMYFSQGSFIYFPPDVPSDREIEQMTKGYEEITVRTEDGERLNGYFRAPKDPNQPIVIVFHGNAALAVDMTYTMSAIANKGYGILLAEYRGYGDNGGTPSEEGLSNDADAYLNWVKQKEDYSSTPVVLYGQSLGSGVAVDLASRVGDKIAGMILEVPFYSAYDVAKQMYPHLPFLKFLMNDKYLSNEKIDKIMVSKLFLLAGKDEVVGLDGGRRLYALAKDPKTLVEYDHAGHMTIYAEGAADDVKAFLENEIGQLQ
jgi:hypothetical protein